MPLQKQLPKRKTNFSKKTSPLPKTEEVKPLTEEEINFIDNTELSSAKPDPKLQLESSLASTRIPVSLIQQFLLSFDAYSEYYTKDSFMKAFNISFNTCKKWMDKKGLPYIEVDRIVLFKKTDVEDFFARYRKIMPALILTLPGMF